LVVVVVGAGGLVVVVVGAGGLVVVVVGAGGGVVVPGFADGVTTTCEEDEETLTSAAAHPLTMA
jgi:hypothetical protein